MTEQICYLLLPVLVWIPGIAEAQTQLIQEPGSGVFSRLISTLTYVILIGVIGFIAFLVYRFLSERNEVFSSSLKTPSKPASTPNTAPIPSVTNPAPGSIFISYRRADSADITGRIYDRLIHRFSREIVFKDVDSIPLGIDFRQHLESALSQCRVLLAIIGDQWVGKETIGGKRRIDDPRDHLRLELEVALARNIPVIPVLVRNASVPGEDQLPQALQSLAYRNGIQIRPDPDFHGDMDRLIKGIESHLTR
jgi:hypothetical protein